MKKTFDLTHPKINIDRMVDSVKHEIKKYLKRERNKSLPEGIGYWEFDCKFGVTEAVAKKVYLKEINKMIDESVANGATSFYVEILAKPGEMKTV
ncbi:DUF6172 family protein [Aliiglaciecola sp. LCG003]|uniref:DUF6172 family protein n=1 Tax=Aliiglaciecola sp. LCG003 TaxID=3053655 RepID=UPI0025744D2C|nr:DUF6172 family protein [Aliiglaciecola sp. LCG003]WJG10674.1 DUF6172 family protein [Aliiglaciecola sp. LCG003]